MHSRRDWAVLAALGVLLELGALRVAGSMDASARLPSFLLGYWAMCVVYFVAVYYVWNHCSEGKALFGFSLAVALALRATFLFADPGLSDDVYRYVWDGRVQRQGVNPYRHAPEALELDHLRDPIYERVNNKEVPTVYPPLMEMLFAAVTSISESVVVMKGAMVLADLAIIGLIAGLLGDLHLGAMRTVVYSWSPLVIVEVSGSGHNDVVAIALLLWAHRAILHRNDALSISLLTLSALAKLLGFLLAPFFVPHVRRTAWLALPLVTLLFLAPYSGVSPIAALRGLVEYGARWRSNDSLFHLIEALSPSLAAAKWIAGALFAGVLAALALRRVPPLRASYFVIGALLLLSTTVHPWYLVWIVPFLCFYPQPAWLLLTATVALAYHAPYLSAPGEPWSDSAVIKLLEYAPFFSLLALSGVLAAWRRVEEENAACYYSLGRSRGVP